MTFPLVQGAIPPPTPTPTPAQAPQLSASQHGDVAGGRAAVVEGHVVPLGQGGPSASAASAHTWGSEAAGSPQRLAFDQTAQRLGTTDPVRIASDIGRQLLGGGPAQGNGPANSNGLGASNGVGPGNGIGPGQGVGPPTGVPNGLPGGANPGGAAQPGLLGAVGNVVTGISSTVNGLLGGLGAHGPAGPGAGGPGQSASVPPGLTANPGAPGASNPLASLISPLAALGSKAVGPIAAPLEQAAATVANTARGATGVVSGVAQSVAGGVVPGEAGRAPTTVVTVAREGAANLSLARGETALGGAPLQAGGPRGADGLALNPLGIPREGLVAALGAFGLPVPVERGVQGAIAPSAGRALAQEALLERMATMFAPTGPGARGGEPGSWMALAAALAARGATEEVIAAYQRAAGDAAADAARAGQRQADGAPAFGPNPTLRVSEDPENPNGSVFVGDGEVFTCRCDSRPPEIIFATGFEAAPASGAVTAQADGDIVAEIAPLSNAAALDVARLPRPDPVTLRRIGGVDVTRSLGDELAFDLDIPAPSRAASGA